MRKNDRPLHGVLERIRLTRVPGGPIYLVAAAGIPNFGDEFITRTWLDWLAENRPDDEVWLDVIEPGRAAHLFADTHPRLRLTNTLWQLAHIEAANNLAADADRVRSAVKRLGSPRVDLGLEALRDMRSIHFLGGGYLNTIWPRNLSLLAAAVEAKSSFGVPIFATGQGFLPQDEATTPWLREQLRQFDFVESRDEEGSALLGVTSGLDDAFLAFRTGRKIFDDQPTPDVMILIQGDFGAGDQEAALVDGIASFARKRAGEGGIGVAEGLPPDDARLLGAFREQLPEAEFFPFARLWRSGLPAREGQEWITTRFHFHLLSAAAGAAGAAIDLGGGYYDVKHRLLERLGTGWPVLTPQQASTENLLVSGTRGGFPRHAQKLARMKERVARRIYGPAAPPHVLAMRGALRAIRNGLRRASAPSTGPASAATSGPSR